MVDLTFKNLFFPRSFKTLNINPKIPCFVYLPGPSLREVVPHRTSLRQIGAYSATVNRFNILEDLIGIEFDFVYVSSYVRFSELYNSGKINNFLNRKDPSLNLLITTHRCYEMFCSGQPKHPGMYISDLGLNTTKWYNSLTALLLVLASFRIQDIYLFGCDGGSTDPKNVYFGQDKISPEMENFAARRVSIADDTERMNKEFWSTFKEFKVSFKPNIYNVRTSKLSYVKCFPEISIHSLINSYL